VDAALLVTTILSLTAALVSVLAVRRLKRHDERRSDARVAALAAAALDDVPLPTAPVSSRHDLPNDDPGRDLFARPAPAKPSQQNAGNRPSAIGHGRSAMDDERRPIDERPPIDDGRFFGTVQRETTSGRFAFVAAAALIVALGGAVVVFTTSGHGQTATPAARAAHAEPLELISLGHSRGDSTLTITGIVRNPSGGPKIEGLTAVVSLIDSHGGLISTKDVPLDYRALGPGEEAPFKMSVPDPGSVARYRVSFRAGTDVVPHVDRRGDTKLASAL
jgi:hypothetical protein